MNAGQYLQEFRAGLRALPEAERAEVVREIENHIAESLESGHSLPEVLERLGPAKRLAGTYTAGAILSGPGHPLGKWFAAAGALFLSSVTSLCVISFLGLIGLSFTVLGVKVMVADILYLILGHPPRGMGITATPLGPDPGWDQVIGIFISLVMVLLGAGALVLLTQYIKFVIGAVRKVVRS